MSLILRSAGKVKGAKGSGVWVKCCLLGERSHDCDGWVYLRIVRRHSVISLPPIE